MRLSKLRRKVFSHISWKSVLLYFLLLVLISINRFVKMVFLVSAVLVLSFHSTLGLLMHL